MGTRIDLRLNDKKHSDIIDAISNVKNKSEEIRRLLRLAINIKYNPGIVIEQPKPKPIIKSKPKELSKDNIEELRQNLLNIDFGADDDE